MSSLSYTRHLQQIDQNLKYLGLTYLSLASQEIAPTPVREKIMLVNSQNEEQGERCRSLAAPDTLWIRASYVFVDVFQEMTNTSKILVQRRSMTKDYAPGCFMLASGGVFSPGEQKLNNALRELEEETGLMVYDDCDTASNDQWIDAGWLNYVDPQSRVWASLYVLRTTQARVNSQLKLQEEEVSDVEFWSKEEIIERIKRQKEMQAEMEPGTIAPCSMAAFEYLYKHNYF